MTSERCFKQDTALQEARHTFVARWTLPRAEEDQALRRLVGRLLAEFSDTDRAVYRPGAGVGDRRNAWLSLGIPAATRGEALSEARRVAASHLETVLGGVPADLHLSPRFTDFG